MNNVFYNVLIKFIGIDVCAFQITTVFLKNFLASYIKVGNNRLLFCVMINNRNTQS